MPIGVPLDQEGTVLIPPLSPPRISMIDGLPLFLGLPALAMLCANRRKARRIPAPSPRLMLLLPLL